MTISFVFTSITRSSITLVLRPLLSALLLSVTLCNCNCNDSLVSAIGQASLQMCDRGTACGCEVLPPDGATIDFGSPQEGEEVQRTLLIRNSNQPRAIEIYGFDVADATDNTANSSTSSFRIISIYRREGENGDIELMESLPFMLRGTQEALVRLAYTANITGEYTSSLSVRSDSEQYSNWLVTLRAGAGSSKVEIPTGDCGTGCSVDFGTFSDSDLGFDSALGLPLSLDHKEIVIRNDGAATLLLNVELTDDGIAETSPLEQVGEIGVFFLTRSAECLLLQPGESLTITADYRPSRAGEHRGEVSITGLGSGGLGTGIGAPVKVELLARVTGAHICIRTEDERPNDALLVFGDPPEFITAQNSEETRKIFVSNCGFQADLEVIAVSFAPDSSADFTSNALPWTSTAPLAPGTEIEFPVTYLPTDFVGSGARGGVLFTSNDRFANTTSVRLEARVGPPPQCVLIASPNPVNFGWVATDDDGVGCDPNTGFCLPGANGPTHSRTKGFTLSNVGELPCTNINVGPVERDVGNAFAVIGNPNGAGFTLAAGAQSSQISVQFTRAVSEITHDFTADLPYQSPDMAISPLNILLKSTAGGSPECRLTFAPVEPPGFLCNQATLAFGNVNFGMQRTVDLKVSNTGSDTCTVSRIRQFGDTSVFTHLPPTTPFTLNVGDDVTFPVKFSPVPPAGNAIDTMDFGCGGFSFPGMGGAGPNKLSFYFISGDAGLQQIEDLPLTGKGKVPDIDVIPGEIDFGDVTVGCCSAEVRVTVYNRGSNTLTLTSVAPTTGSDPGFRASTPSNMSLPAGGSITFNATFCAGDEGNHSGLIQILSDDPNEFFTVGLTGNGTLSNAGSDTYTQPLRPKVDVLWVVDDSGSMSEEQANLANNFDAFINTAVGLDTDYHIGVINTDSVSEEAGHLYSCNPPLWISDTQTTTQQQTQFRCNVRTSDSGRPGSDSKESPLQAARAALEYPNIDAFNAGFYRDDATLYIVLVTDEEDQSDGSAQMYVDFFRNLKGIGNPDLLNISAITGPLPNGCDTADANQKDWDAVSLVGGQFRSICTADWSNLISNLGLDVFNARRQFPMSRPATESTIVVTVCAAGGSNCRTIPHDINNGWSYDSTLNSVVFHGTSAPTAGEEVSFGYTAMCFGP